MIFGLDCTQTKKCDIHIFKKHQNNSNYHQTDCIFCCKNFTTDTNDTITLSCKHVYHLHCFINYTKMNYLTNKNKNIACPLCNNNNNILDIFKKYKVVLEIRNFWTKKYNIVKNIYVYKDIFSNDNSKIDTLNAECVSEQGNLQIKNEEIDTLNTERVSGQGNEETKNQEIKNSEIVEIDNEEIKNQENDNLQVKRYTNYDNYYYKRYFKYYKYDKYDSYKKNYGNKYNKYYKYYRGKKECNN